MAVYVRIPIDKSGALVVVSNPAIHPLMPYAGVPIMVVKDSAGNILSVKGQLSDASVIFNNPA